MFAQAIKTEITAIRLLFTNRLASLLLVLTYAALLGASYLFVSTREATVAQLIVTLALLLITPALFVALQALSINYVNAPAAASLIKKTTYDSLRLIAVSLPLLAITALALYGLGKIQSHLTIVGAVRYLLIGLIVPLLTIQLWVAASREGFSQVLRRAHKIAVNAFAPQSVFVYACGVLVFAVAPYFLIFHTTQTERAWVEVSLLTVRLVASALLILLGWVTTVGTFSLLSKH